MDGRSASAAGVAGGGIDCTNLRVDPTLFRAFFCMATQGAAVARVAQDPRACRAARASDRVGRVRRLGRHAHVYVRFARLYITPR